MERLRTLVAPVLAGATRVALGGLWLHEGLFKYHAHFGSADILLVADSTAGNSRVPSYFAPITSLLHAAPGLLGVVMPLAETLLGVALVLGVLTVPLAAVSVLQLMTYWSADQLIGQYPIMVLLSAAVLLMRRPATRFSLDRVVFRRRHRMALPAWLRG